MDRKFCWIVVFVVMAIFVSCHKTEKLDQERDKALIEAMKSAQGQSDRGIDIDALEKSIVKYEKRGEMGKVCWCNALIGYKLYANGNYDKSLIHLKRAEANLSYCDTISAFVYSLITSNTMHTDTAIAREYAQKALKKDLQYNSMDKIGYSYMYLGLLTTGDSAWLYLQKSLHFFDEDAEIMTKAKFAKYHAAEMNADSVIEYVKPYYERIRFVGYARILMEAYLRKGLIDSTTQYLEHLASRSDYENDYFYCKAEALMANGEFEEGCRWWKRAYECNEKDWNFMISQRLGAINAEYDLLNAELENKKKLLRVRGMYIVALMLVIVALVVTYIVKERHRRNADKLKLNVDALEMDVNVLEGNVCDLKQELSDLEQDVKRRRARFAEMFEAYRKAYNIHRDSILADAQMNLKEFHGDYPELTKTELSIVWLIFMDCSRETICELLSITQSYYYQRRSAINQILNQQIKEGEALEDTINRLMRQYLENK